MLGQRYVERTSERRFDKTKSTTEKGTERSTGDDNGRRGDAERWRRADVKVDRILAIEPEIWRRVCFHKTSGNVRPERRTRRYRLSLQRHFTRVRTGHGGENSLALWRERNISGVRFYGGSETVDESPRYWRENRGEIEKQLGRIQFETESDVVFN